MTDLISVTVNDGKYTIQQTAPGQWQALRYNEAWPAFADSGPDNLHVELAYEVHRLREKLKRLGSFETMTNEGWGFSHPELTARTSFAKAALTEA